MTYVIIPYLKRVELASRAYECLFIGYALNNKTYRFYDLNVKVVIESNDVDFHEKISHFKREIIGASKQVTFL